MSEENVALVREAWDAWLKGDMEALFAWYDAQVVWDLTHFRDWPDKTYRGKDGVQRFLAEWLDVWDAYEVGVDEILPAPDGRVVTLAWQRGKGRHSGLAMEMEWASISTIRDGKITLIDNYDNRAEALEAAGLSE